MSAWLSIIGNYDERLLFAVVTRRRRALDVLMRGVTRLADPPLAITLAMSLALGLIPALTDTGRVMLATLAVSHGFVQILKRFFTRPRPELPVGLDTLIKLPECFSFPSGHAAAGLSLFLPLALALPLPWAAIAMTLAFMIGVSRCYLGLHYPGDVVMGWLLAAGTMVWLAEPTLGLFGF